jgi:hypothetical protein
MKDRQRCRWNKNDDDGGGGGAGSEMQRGSTSHIISFSHAKNWSCMSRGVIRVKRCEIEREKNTE